MPAHPFSGLRLDEVCYLGKVRFLIPHHWIEESEEDHSCFCEKGTESGWLRVSLITVKSPGEVTQQRVLALLRKDLPREAEVYAAKGNGIKRWRKFTSQDSVPLCIYYWDVGRCISPDLIRVAVFSYTVLADRVDLKRTHDEVKLVEDLVTAAEFVEE